MRDILRLERLALDAVEQLDGPTMGEVLDYVAARRRLWWWQAFRVVGALHRLEDARQIEWRRTMPTPLGPACWRYYLLCGSELPVAPPGA
jgi:hypothetical protein